VLLNRLANGLEYVFQCLFFRLGEAERMVGVDAGEGQGLGVKIGAGERLHMAVNRLTGMKEALFIHIDNDRGNLQQGICSRIESGGFHIDDHGKKSAKAAVDSRYEWIRFHR